MKFISDIEVDSNNVETMIEVLLRFNFDLLAKAYDNSIMEVFSTKLL